MRSIDHVIAALLLFLVVSSVFSHFHQHDAIEELVRIRQALERAWPSVGGHLWLVYVCGDCAGWYEDPVPTNDAAEEKARAWR